MNLFPPSPRLLNGLIALACACLIATALFLQKQLGLHPCPLCITQRICIMLVGVVALLALIHNPGKVGLRIYAVLQILAASTGAAVAGRHVWIQNLPEDQIPACGPGLQYMFDHFPFMDALSLLLRGDGNCAIVDWTLMGLSMPAWVLICCVGLLLVNFFQLLRR